MALRYRERVRELGCLICRRAHRGYVPASIHHCRWPVGAGQKASDLYAIPLAPPIHQLALKDDSWPWQDDVPIHAGERPFRERYGVYEQELLIETCDLLGVPYPPKLVVWIERQKVATCT